MARSNKNVKKEIGKWEYYSSTPSELREYAAFYDENYEWVQAGKEKILQQTEYYGPEGWSSTTPEEQAKLDARREKDKGYYGTRFQSMAVSKVPFCEGEERPEIDDFTMLPWCTNSFSDCYRMTDDIYYVTEALGEPLDAYNGWTHAAELKPDGHVEVKGGNRWGECDVQDWTEITQVSCGIFHTVGLRQDGTVVACGSNVNGQCEVGNLPGKAVAVSCGRYHTAILLASGHVVLLGHTEQEPLAARGGEYFTLEEFPVLLTTRVWYRCPVCNADMTWASMCRSMAAVKKGDPLTIRYFFGENTSQEGQIERGVWYDGYNVVHEATGKIVGQLNFGDDADGGNSKRAAEAEIVNDLMAMEWRHTRITAESAKSPFINKRTEPGNAMVTMNVELLDPGDPQGRGGYIQTPIALWPPVKKIRSIYDAVLGIAADGSYYIDGYCPLTADELKRVVARMRGSDEI